MVRVVLTFIHGVFVARLYGAEAYGIYTEGVAIVILLSAFAQVGLARSATRFVAAHMARNQPSDIRNTLKIVLGISMPIAIGIGVMVSIKSDEMSMIFHEPVLASSFRVLGIAIPALTLATLLAAFTQGFRRMHHKTIALDFFSPLIELIGIVLFTWLGMQRISLPIAYVCAVVMSSILLIHFSRVDLRTLAAEFPQHAQDSSNLLLKPILRYTMPVWGYEILAMTTLRSGVLLLGLFASSTMVGIFGILQKLVGFGGIFLLSTNAIFGPMVTDVIERQQFHELARLHKLSTRWILAVSVPMFLILVFFGDSILRFYGQVFVSGLSALFVLISAAILDLSTGTSGTILIMSGHPKYNVINELVKLLIIVFLAILFIPKYGVLGIAYPIAIGTIIFCFLQIVEVWKLLGIHPYSKSLVKVALASGVMTAILGIWREFIMKGSDTWYLIILGSVFALTSYCVILFVLGLEDNEIELLRVFQQRVVRILGA